MQVPFVPVDLDLVLFFRNMCTGLLPILILCNFTKNTADRVYNLFRSAISKMYEL